MEFPIKFDMMKSAWSIVYVVERKYLSAPAGNFYRKAVEVYLYIHRPYDINIKGSQVIISKIIIFLSLKIDYVLANSADLDGMQHCQSTILGVSGL